METDRLHPLNEISWRLSGKKKMSVSHAGRQRRSFSKGDSPSASSSLSPARPRFRRDCSITSPCPSDSLARRDRCCYLAFFALSGSNEYKVGGNCRRRRQFQVSLGHQTSGGGPPWHVCLRPTPNNPAAAAGPNKAFCLSEPANSN